MAEFNQTLNELRRDPANQEVLQKAFQSMADFDKFRHSNAFYIGPDVMKNLGEIWEKAVEVVSNPASSAQNPLKDKMSDAENSISLDLDKTNLLKISETLKGS
jgi:hypothetical protein